MTMDISKQSFLQDIKNYIDTKACEEYLTVSKKSENDENDQKALISIKKSLKNETFEIIDKMSEILKSEILDFLDKSPAYSIYRSAEIRQIFNTSDDIEFFDDSCKIKTWGSNNNITLDEFNNRGYNSSKLLTNIEIVHFKYHRDV